MVLVFILLLCLLALARSLIRKVSADVFQRGGSPFQRTKKPLTMNRFKRMMRPLFKICISILEEGI